MIEQKDFPRRDIGQGWFVQYDSHCSIRSQKLVFDMPGAQAQHHTGQVSVWHINGKIQRVVYLCGDSYRKPDENTVGRACEALKQLEEEGELSQRSRVKAA